METNISTSLKADTGNYKMGSPFPLLDKIGVQDSLLLAE